MRGFLIGSGRTLEHVDLTMLSGEFVITCNRIHRHPSWDDGFRPDVWVFGDNYGNPKFKEEIIFHVQQGYDCWIKSSLLEMILNERMEPDERFWWPDYANVIPYQNCYHRRDMRKPSGWHPPVICNFTGAINAMVQIAVWHYDVDEILLLGCDGKIVKGKTGNHFTDDYQSTWYGPPVVDRINDELYIGHSIIAKECEMAGVKVLNLSPDSAFDQHEKARLEDVLEPVGV